MCSLRKCRSTSCLSISKMQTSALMRRGYLFMPERSVPSITSFAGIIRVLTRWRQVECYDGSETRGCSCSTPTHQRRSILLPGGCSIRRKRRSRQSKEGEPLKEVTLCLMRAYLPCLLTHLPTYQACGGYPRHRAEKPAGAGAAGHHRTLQHPGVYGRRTSGAPPEKQKVGVPELSLPSTSRRGS